MKDIKTNIIGFIEFGGNDEVVGICLFDKYCYTTTFGFEILK
tara:strand:- start:2558 stop:2683 length:126 start_codon:yes stop_codon:yes gene_type:complete